MTGLERALAVVGVLGVVGLGVVVQTNGPGWLMGVDFVVIAVGIVGTQALFQLRMKRLR